MAKDVGAPHCEYITGRTKMQFSHMHGSMTLLEKHAMFFIVTVRHLRDGTSDGTQRILISFQMITILVVKLSFFFLFVVVRKCLDYFFRVLVKIIVTFKCAVCSCFEIWHK